MIQPQGCRDLVARLNHNPESDHVGGRDVISRNLPFDHCEGAAAAKATRFLSRSGKGVAWLWLAPRDGT